MSFSAWLELIASGLITGGIYALVALGLNLQYGLMRILNIAHGEFLMVGAFLTWMVQTSFGLSPLWMIPVSFGLLYVLGVAVHWLCFRRLTATSPNLDVFEARGLMVAFGLMFLVQNFISYVWGGDLRGYDYLTQPLAIPLPGGSAQFAVNKLVVFRARPAVLRALSSCCLRLTLLGKGVRALMQSPTGAQLMGINTKRLHPHDVRHRSGPLGRGRLPALHGLHHQPVDGRALHPSPRSSSSRSAASAAWVARSRVALLLGVIEALGMHFTNPSLKALLSYVVFIGVLLLRPEGLFARKSRKA
jgi:branched-chain amino acid transport system permease protein